MFNIHDISSDGRVNHVPSAGYCASAPPNQTYSGDYGPKPAPGTSPLGGENPSPSSATPPPSPPPMPDGSIPNSPVDSAESVDPNELTPAQRATLWGHLARHPNSMQSAMRYLKDEQFNTVTESCERLVWAMLSDHYKKHSALPSEGVVRGECEARAQGSPELLSAALEQIIASIYAAPVTTWSHAKELLAKWLNQRHVKRLLEESMDLPTDQRFTSIQDAIADVQALHSGAGESNYRPLSEWLGDPDIFCPPDRIQTGYPALDDALDGGFKPKGMYLLAGQTSRGKSLLAVNLAHHVARIGCPVVLITLEDTGVDAARHLLALESKLPVKQIDYLEKLNTEQAQSIKAAAARLRALPLGIEDQTTELPAIESFIRRRAAEGAMLVILDQSSWVGVPETEGVFEAASELSRRLKILARELKIVILVLVQVNRSGALLRDGGDRIKLFHIRDSGRWEQDADGVLIIQGLKVESTPAEMEIEVAKHRGCGRDRVCWLLATLPESRVDDDPARLKFSGSEETTVAEKTKKIEFSSERFQLTFLNQYPKLRPIIIKEAMDQGLTAHKAGQLLTLLIAQGLVYRWKTDRGCGYATVMQPKDDPLKPSGSTTAKQTKAAVIEQVLKAEPTLSDAEVATKCKSTPQYVGKIRSKIGGAHV